MAKPAGLRAEIIVNLIVLLAAALVFVSVLQLKVSERELLRERVELVTSLCETMAFGVGTALEHGEPLRRVLPGGFDAMRQLTVVDGDLRTVFRLRGEQSLPVRGELNAALLSRQTEVRVDYDGSWWPATEASRQRVVVTVPVEVRGGPYLVQGDVSLADLRERLFAAQKPLVLYLLLFGAILVGFGSTLIGRTMVKPVRRLMLATQNVARGELGEGVEASGLREVAELAASFNSMTEALQKSRQETATHIEELRHTNRELRETRDELVRSEKLASVGHLAAGMAHELGNPLGALIGYLGLLEHEVEDDARELVTRAQGEASRIDRLVRELLDYAAPAHLNREPFDPLAALHEALALLDQQQALEPLQILQELPASLPQVCGSSAKLVQVFINLLLNARDACEQQRGELRVEAEALSDAVVFRICDNGAGIRPEDLPHIFDPFFTTKPQGKGRGLGLAVCHHILLEMGGRIDVNSAPGQGTCFSIHLPHCGEPRT